MFCVPRASIVRIFQLFIRNKLQNADKYGRIRIGWRLCQFNLFLEVVLISFFACVCCTDSDLCDLCELNNCERSKPPCRANGAPGLYNWGERERAPTLLMSMEIVCVCTCVHVRPPDCACAKSGYRIFLNVYVIYVVFL